MSKQKMTTAATTGCGGEGLYDRSSDVKQFEDSKLGVKGLVDSGLTSIPRFFVHPPETLSDLKRRHPSPDLIPTIDLSGQRPAIVEKMARASRRFGFFQIVNHGVPAELMERVVGSVTAFHDQPAEDKARFYRRGMGHGVSFLSNVDLVHSKAASWRDTLQLRLCPKFPKLEEIPEICRKEVVEWNRESKRLGEVLLSLLCQGLGLDSSKLDDMGGRMMVGQYYPLCPQPDLTVGIDSHTDPGLLTILLQDQIGGLQIKHGETWWDVKPVPGALVINIGDVFQIISNNEYVSVEHRVLANPFPKPRVSIAVFFHAFNRENVYGPFQELISPEKPALFRQFKYSEFITRFLTNDLDGMSLVNYYKL